MPTATKPLFTLTAHDLMSRDVIALKASLPLRTAAQLLGRSHITGAPVVDEQGRCVGVLSTTDLAQWAEQEAAGDGPRSRACGCGERHAPHVEVLPAHDVGEYMTPDPVTVPADAPIAALAHAMVDAHIHRVIVVDDARRPVGIVSSTDLLAALARAGAAARAS